MAKNSIVLSNSSYDNIKWIAQVFLPAVATLYFAIATIWGLPWSEEVVGTITALDAFLGILLGIASNSYTDSDDKYDGVIDVTTGMDNIKRFTLVLNGDPEQLDQNTQALFKINSSTIE